MRVLVTGGAGYVGSHTIIELQSAGHDVIVVDNLSNSSRKAIQRVEAITKKSVPLHVCSVEDEPKLDALFAANQFDAVIHFAGLKSVGESTSNPLMYYQVNLGSTLTLLRVMATYNVTKLLFSSSATVYGDPQELPITESSPVGSGLTNPYGKTKYMIEEILRDTCAANESLEVTVLRYFNPVGAHESGNIGEDPLGPPNNLFPYIAQVAVGKREKLLVHGDDYNTVDGTGVRDYIHVVDLARGHVAALDHSKPGWDTYNLGTGHGTSVLEAVEAFGSACGHDIPYEIGPRRPGDIAACYASPRKANDELGWQTTKTLADACADTWRWQSANPDDYRRP